MSGTIRFDDEHIVKFVLDAENLTLTYEIKVEDLAYTDTVELDGDAKKAGK